MKNKFHTCKIVSLVFALTACDSGDQQSDPPKSGNVTSSNLETTSPRGQNLKSEPPVKNTDLQNLTPFVATWSGATFPAVDKANRGRFKIENGCVVVHVEGDASTATVIFPDKTRLSIAKSVKTGLQLPNGQNIEFGVKYTFSGNSAGQIPVDALNAPIPKQCPQTVFAIGDIIP